MLTPTLTPTATPVAAAKNRARHVVIGVTMLILVSLTYSYSVFRTPLGLLHGWTKAQTIAPYQYMLLMVSIGSVIGGLWQDRKGGRIVASTGGLMIGLGFILAVFFGDSIAGLIVTFGIIVGLGIGLAYVTPIANLLKWFPDKRGFVVGIAVMGSGFSALFWAPSIEAMIGKDPAQYAVTLPRTFEIMAVIFSIAVIGMAHLYRLPPPGWKPEGWTPPAGTQVNRSFTSREMLATPQFYLLYVTYFLGASVGLTAIGQAAPMFQEVGMAGAAMSAGVALGIVAVFNAVGRLSWGGLSDKVGRKWTLVFMSIVTISACLGFLRSGSGFWSVMIGLCLAAFAYGGYLALMPAFTADYFGSKSVGGNYGILFTAWGVCGFVMPGYFERVLDQARVAGDLAGGYRDVYLQLAVMAVAVLVMGAFLHPPRAAKTS